MYYYFSADFPSVIKLNGIYFGKIFETVKSLNMDYEKPPFIEICPLDSNYRQINFVCDDDFLVSPPENISVTNLKGGYFINITESPVINDFKILAQEKFPFAVVTVFYDNRLKISIETPTDFYAENLNFTGTSANIKIVNIDRNDFLLIEIKNKKSYIYIYDLKNKITKIFSCDADSYSVENGFQTTNYNKDIAKHKINIVYGYDGNTIVERNKNVFKDENFSVKNLNEKILPYAFMEELICGGNIIDYLTDEIKEKISSLGGYLGEFIGIMPPPVFRSINETGLIYKEKENVYYVEWFIFEIENGKISNIKRSAE